MGVVGHLKSGCRGWGYILLCMVNILLVTDFSALKKNVKLTRDLKPLFVLFFCFLFFSIKKTHYFACQLFNLPPSCAHQKPPPSFRSISKALSSPL
jgi:hypothetical protein